MTVQPAIPAAGPAPRTARQTPAQRALAASASALGAAGLALLAFLPPVLASTLQSVPLIVLAGLVLATGLLLHWAFLAIGARRLGRSPLGWLVLAVGLAPVGGLAALVLLGWYGSEPAVGEGTA